MNRTRRITLAALLAVAAMGATAPAQADASQDCDTRLAALEAQFYDMADRRSYEEASEWWQARWHAYHTSCVMH